MQKKVYELAKEIGVGAIDLVERLKKEGMDVKNHMVSLDADQVAKAMALYSPAEPEVKTSKKKVTKKKTAKKKVTKKKTTTVKKVTGSKSEDEGTEKKASKAPEETSDSPKTKVIKKKTVRKKIAAKKEAAQEAAEEKELMSSGLRGLEIVEQAPVKKTPSNLATPKSAEPTPEEEKVFKERMHAFTPVFVPEKKNDEQKDDNKAAPKGPQTPVDPSDIQAQNLKNRDPKKRMGDLAAAVSKKGASGRGKDVTSLRVEEEMRLANTVMGRQVYTPMKRKKVFTGATKSTEITEVKDSKRVVNIHKAVTGSDLAQKLSQKFSRFQYEVAEKLNILVNETDYLGFKLSEQISAIYDYRVEDKAFDEQKAITEAQVKPKSDAPLRNPIITVMGHVDHGKTTLLDFVRKASVVDGEAGGITQHIGAYSVKVDKSTLTFLDTPGHAAFANMRQRGAKVTDIVVLVVAADDGVMPQTKESIKFAKDAGCPIIVAINKMDKETANPDRVKQELSEFELLPEEWGGDTQFVPISALKGDGMDNLLESIKLQAEIMELRESPKGAAEGVIVESKVETGRGPLTTVLVQKGTLKKGDAVVCGEFYGRARSLMDHASKQVKDAGPSIPVVILGLNGIPNPGDILNVVKSEREAKKIAENRADERKKLESTEAPKVTTLEDFFGSDTAVGEKKILNLVIRADVQGSYEAIVNAIEPLGNNEVGVKIIAGGVGAISDNDVTMAASSGGIILGFNMRPITSARKLSEQKGVEIRTYSIIYELINEVTQALEGMLEPEKVEKYIGRAEVRDTFNIPKIGTIAGSAVIDGKIERGCHIRLLREGRIIYNGKLSTLKRFKDEVKEVATGYECGMALEGFNDIKNNDLIEAYVLEEKKRKLEASETQI